MHASELHQPAMQATCVKCVLNPPMCDDCLAKPQSAVIVGSATEVAEFQKMLLLDITPEDLGMGEHDDSEEDTALLVRGPMTVPEPTRP